MKAHWHVVFFIPFLQLYVTVQESNDKNAEAKDIEIRIPKGTSQFNLRCLKNVWEENDHVYIWKKNNKPVFFPTNRKFNLKGLPSHTFPLLCVDKKDEGSYTCHAQKYDGMGKTNGTKNSLSFVRRINVTVSVSNSIDTCGNIKGKKLIEIYGTGHCEAFLQTDYPCCGKIPNPAKTMNMALLPIWRLSDSYNKCDIYRPKNPRQPWEIFLYWKLHSIGDSGTWGWQIRLNGLSGAPNEGYCVQINSKDKKLNWTFTANILTMGATYNVTLQALPEATIESNLKYKIITIPSWQDMCEMIDSSCNWEVCISVENLTVTNHSSFPLVSWTGSPFYRTPYMFEVIYSNEDGSDSDRNVVKNESYRLDKLKYKYPQKYFVEVRPVFIIGEHEYRYGKMSKKLIFYVAADHPPSGGSYNILKIVIAVSVAATTLAVITFILVYKYVQKPGQKPESNENGVQNETDQVNDVLLVHDGHCHLCNDVTHKLARILCETGHIKCYLDLCSAMNISEIGPFRWYEEKIQSCQNILIICTKEAKKTWDESNSEGINSQNQARFRFALSMILGKIANGERVQNNNRCERNGKGENRQVIIPVYFDYSSWQDIPGFLKDRQFYSLPSQIQELLLCLCGFNSRQLYDPAEYAFEYRSKLQRMIKECEDAIQKVRKSHCGRSKGSLINYVGRSFSFPSKEENSRV